MSDLRNTLIGLLLALAVADVSAQDYVDLDLRRTLFNEDYQTLLAGEREFLLIKRESLSPLTRGVAMLVGDLGANPMSHSSLAPLAPLLNQYGWLTMSMPAPYLSEEVRLQMLSLSSAETGTADSTEPSASAQQQNGDPNPPALSHPKTAASHASMALIKAQKQGLLLQLQAVNAEARQYPGFRLVIAHGTSAAALLEMYAENVLPPPDAFVMISPFWPDRQRNIALARHLANTTMPVMELYTQGDNDYVLAHAREREIAAEKALKLHYRQHIFMTRFVDSEQFHLLGKRIYGWLVHMGW